MTDKTQSMADDFWAFIHYYLPHQLSHPLSDMHKEWCHDLEDQYIAIAAPRGFAKSHLFSFFYPLYRLLEDNVDIVLVSSTEKQAEWFLSKIVRELETNERIIEDYGPQKGPKWRNNYIELLSGSTCRCAGAEGKIRGKRPDILLLDDIENDENVLSEDWRNKLANWFWKAAMYTLKPKGQVIFIGTLVHPLALITRLCTDSNLEGWTRHKYQGLVDGKSVWEGQWPTAELLKRRDLNPAAFEQEIQNNPIPDEWRKFDPLKIRFYDELPKGLAFTTTIDAAFELHDKADYTVILTQGIDQYGNRFIADLTRKRLQPNEIIEEVFAHQQRWNPLKIGIPEMLLEKTLKFYLKIEENKRNIRLPIEPIKTEASGVRKRYRVEALVPYVNEGLIWIHKEKHKELLSELICWPTAEHDDTVDALSMQLQFDLRPSYATEHVNPRSIKAIINKFHRAEDNKGRKRLWHA